MNQLLAQSPLTVSLDDGPFLIAGIVALICGGGYVVFRGRPIASIVIGSLSLLLAAFIPLSNRYDPEFVTFSVPLLVLCCACFTGAGIWRIFGPARLNA